MPDIACKAIFVVHLPLGFLILLWDVHGAGPGIYLSFYVPDPSLQLPECGTSSCPETSGLAPGVGRGRGTLFPENDLALGISCDHFSRTSPLLPPEAQTPTAERSRKVGDPSTERSSPAGGRPPSPRSPSSGPAAESPDVGFNPYARSFISIKGQWLGGAEIAAPRAPPASPAQLPPPPRAPPRPAPSPGSVRGPQPTARPRGTVWDVGEAARPAPGGSAGQRRREPARPPRAGLRLRGRGERGGALGERRGAATAGLH